ncbi:uncharacterized protein LOC111401642 isoform X1 [Olea europaea var. sylvestris]|uniref:uncharacterized protein LOC111401642 isoform X1 n=1 Tax=Olea europaea var. sylvestris TaxID=158386 RepID=UPI000C1D3936|nr:uncharacterized protein LOC111401642 isoform X1 [Olea europaea var. sylvestris]XP_022885240.1 uncharacterized protein LOC111401642 isoform X1 [Olea europaea var. sylvestris]
MDDSKSSADDGEINAGCGIKSSVTMKDAIAFMYSGKTVLGAKSDGFVNLFKDYAAKRIDARQVISGAILLLKGHRDELILLQASICSCLKHMRFLFHLRMMHLQGKWNRF